MHLLTLCSLRPRRSRKDRPCDRCRRSKRSCHITVRGQACEHCRKAGRECSFIAPPLNRHRQRSTSPDGDARPHDVSPHRAAPSTSTGASASGSTVSAPRFSGPPISSFPIAPTVPWMGERPTFAAPLAQPSSSVVAFLDSLEDDPRRHASPHVSPKAFACVYRVAATDNNRMTTISTTLHSTWVSPKRKSRTI